MDGYYSIDVSNSPVPNAFNYRMEDPSYPLTDPEWAREYFGLDKTDAGITVNHRTSLSYAPVWQAVQMISGDVARLPLILTRRAANGDTSSAKDHWAYRVAKHRANLETIAFKFWKRLMVHALLWGNGYAYIDRRNRQLYPLLPDRTMVSRVEEVAPTEPRRGLFVVTEAGGREWTMPYEDVIHIEGICCDNVCGRDLVKAARDEWARGLAALKFTSKFFARGGRLGGLLQLPEGLPPQTRDRIERGFRDTYETPDAAFKTVILRDGATFHSAQATLEEASMAEITKQSVRDVARFFNLSPSRLGEDDGGGYGSKSEDNRDYMDTTLSQWLYQIRQECDDKLLTDRERWGTPEHYFRHDTESLLQLSPQEQAEVHALAIQNMWLSPNEVRRASGMNGRPGGDIYVNPNTTSAETTAMAAAKIEPHVRSLVHATTRNLVGIELEKASRKCKTNKSYCDWLDGREAREAKLRAALTPVAAIAGGSVDAAVKVISDQVEQPLSDLGDTVVELETLRREVDRLRNELDLEELSEAIVEAWK